MTVLDIIIGSVSECALCICFQNFVCYMNFITFVRRDDSCFSISLRKNYLTLYIRNWLRL